MNVHMMTQLNLGRKLFGFAEMTQVNRWDLFIDTRALNEERMKRKGVKMTIQSISLY